MKEKFAFKLSAFLSSSVVHSIRICLLYSQVYCDQDTEGGGWTVFQRRQDGSVDFYRNWKDYERGFGDPDWEFWLGNYALSKLTGSCCNELRVDMTDFEGEKVYAHYSNFKVTS